MSDGVGRIHEKIRSFQKRYYLNIFIKGLILTLSILLGFFLIASILEHNLWLGKWARFLIFFTFFATAAYCILRFLNQPLKWWIAKRGLSEEETAKLIGKSIPTVKDSLLNLIQLAASGKNSSLTYASIEQRSHEFEPVQFESAIDIKANKKYLKYLAIPVVLVLIILIINQNILMKSTERIVNFNQEYSPEAPFKFQIKNASLRAYYNEDFKLDISLSGNALPGAAYIVTKNQRLKLHETGKGTFEYLFEKIQEPVAFQIEAAGFFSDRYEITIIQRPEVTGFHVELNYPRYLGLKNQKIINAGNLEVPEGTEIFWNVNAQNTDEATIKFASSDSVFSLEKVNNQIFKFKKFAEENDQYEVQLVNNQIVNKDKISYSIDVVKDQHPNIKVDNLQDSVLYQRVLLGGSIADDYGLTQLTLNFRIRNEEQKEIISKSVKIPIHQNQPQQNFFYNWSVDSLKLQPGHQLEYYLQVWDNDGVNGRKSTKSSTYTFLVPSKDNLISQITKSQSETEQQISKSVNNTNKLQEQIEKAYQKIKGKQNLDWQDKKMLEDIVQQKQQLDKAIENLKEQNKLLEEKKEAFTEQDEKLKEKAAQIQKLMDELLDEETKKLFEELQKLLKENTDVSQIQKLLDKMNQNTNNMEKEMERTLELFKELQYDFKLDQTIKEVEKQIESQKSILEQTESLEKQNKSGKNKNSQSDQNQKSAEQLAKEQEQLNEDFNKTQEKLNELEKLGEELKKKDEELPSEEQQKEIDKEQEESKEMLKQNNPSKAKQSQQKAVQQLQKMQEQMEGMQSSMEMEMNMENIESLRQIIHGLVKLSFDQEGLMKEFNALQQSDPRFNSLAQLQLKLKDDAKVLEDSLLALGKRDPMMGSFVTKEIGELNNHIEKVIEANKERRRPQSSSEMQMTMTSINNLALMLDDHFDMMMQMMANSTPSMGKPKKGQKPSLSQMQQQLNQKIQELKNSGKTGRQLSEELAEMAAEQERIRRALQEMQEKMKEDGKMPGGDLPSKMEQTEMDLVNKQLTDQMIKRQKDILTRLLETEKSMREQDMDEERKGETAKDYEKEMPKAFEDYLRLKEKEVELLKTVPPKLYPYYKKEVSEYFKRMGNQ